MWRSDLPVGESAVVFVLRFSSLSTLFLVKYDCQKLFAQFCSLHVSGSYTPLMAGDTELLSDMYKNTQRPVFPFRIK